MPGIRWTGLARLARAGVPVLLLVAGPAGALAQVDAAFASPKDRPSSERLWSRLSALSTRPAQLSVASVPLSEALEALSKSSGVPIAFSPSMLAGNRLVSCLCERLTVAQALDQLLQSTWFGYREMEGQIVVAPMPGRVQSPEMSRFAFLPAPRLGGSGSAVFDALRKPLTVTGPVAGTVLDTHSSPIPDARVTVRGTSVQTRADILGRFRFESIPGNEVTLEVTIIGFRPLSQEVRVGDTNVQLVLTAAAVNLEEIVVTGTAGGVERKTLGNSVSTISATQLADRMAPASDLTKLINARAPGVLFQPASGAAGGGGRIRLRGAASLTLAMEPLIYVDGVRMDNRVGTGPSTGSSATSAGIWPSMSRLNDINPDEIERVEIIKGPAAATLYGTEAANGVIQIFTKRGTPGKAKWLFDATNGVGWLSSPERRFRQIYRTRADGSVYHFNLVETENARGTPIFRNAPIQRYAGNVSGGSDAAQYFVGATYGDEQGVLAPNQQRRFTGNVNIQAQVAPKLGLSASAHYITGRTNVVEESVTSGNGTVGSLDNPYRIVDPLTDAARGFNVAAPEAWRSAFDFHQAVKRYTWSMQARHNPLSWFAHRVTLGQDAVYEDNVSMNERLPDNLAQFFAVVRNGRRDVNEISSARTSVDYSGTATARLTTALSSKTSVGAQLYRSETTTRLLSGEDFPAVGLEVVGAATRITAGENYLRNTTIGLFLEEKFEWKQRLFLTAGLRGDDNSSFGADFKAAAYPKLSAAWVISEEPFWSSVPLVNTLRLRAAFGASGQQPDAFSALRTYAAISGPGDVSAVRPQSPGNPKLGPERGQELEGGFEMGLLKDRVSLELTYYDKRTKDVIVTRQTPPSEGFTSPQVVNLGEIRNHGLEAMAKAGLVQGRRLNWDVGFNLSTNYNKVVSLGGGTPLTAGANQYHVVGFPIAAFFEKLVIGGDLVSGQMVNLTCDAGGGADYTAPSGRPVPCATAPRVYLGKPLPTVEGAVTTSLTVFNRLTLSGLLDFKFGATAFDVSTYLGCLTARQCEINYFPDQDRVKAAWYALPGVFGRSVTPAHRNFAKIREVSVAYSLPARWLRGLGVTSARIAVTGRELHTFKGSYEGADPETVTQTGTWYYINFHQLPPPTMLLTSIKLTF